MMIVEFGGTKVGADGVRVPRATIKIDNAADIVRMAVGMRAVNFAPFEELALDLLMSLLLNIGKQGYDLAVMQAGMPSLAVSSEDMVATLEAGAGYAHTG